MAGLGHEPAGLILGGRLADVLGELFAECIVRLAQGAGNFCGCLRWNATEEFLGLGNPSREGSGWQGEEGFGENGLQPADAFDGPDGRRQNFVGHHFWARGYWVSTVGRNEALIRKYIQAQEQEDKRLDQLGLFEGQKPL